MKTEPIPRRSKISTLDLYLLVASIVELHEETNLKILGNEVCRTRQPLWGQYRQVLASKTHMITKVTIQHKIQILGFNGKKGYLRRKR